MLRALLSLALVVACSAATIHIGSEHDRVAVQAKFAGLVDFDTVQLGPGTHFGVCNVSIAASAVTIRGNGPSITILNCSDDSRHFRVTGNNVTISNLQMALGAGDESGGGCLVVDAPFSRLYNVLLRQCRSATIGGALLLAAGAELNLQDVNLTQSEADHGGALFVQANATLIMRGTSIVSLNAAVDGGALFASPGSRITLRDSVRFQHNQADEAAEGAGGAVFILGGRLDVEDSVVFASNSAFNGGAISAQTGATVAIRGRTAFSSNSVPFLGGALHAVQAELLLSGDVSFAMNDALAGGAIQFAEGTLRARGRVRFEDNGAVWGGAVATNVAEMVAEEGVLFARNSAVWGGAIDQGSLSSVLLAGSVQVVDNVAEYLGSAIHFAFSSTTILAGEGVVVERCLAYYPFGGSIVASRSQLAVVDGATLQNNTNGAVHAEFRSLVTLHGAALRFNEAEFGAAVSLEFGSRLTCSNSTLESNAAAMGGAIGAGFEAAVELGRGAQVRENVAGVAGGGVMLTQDSRLEVGPGAVVEGNLVALSRAACPSSPCGGGGVALRDSAHVTLQRGGAVRKNRAASGGGILLGGATEGVVAGGVEGNWAEDGGGVAVLNTSALRWEGGQCERNEAAHQGGCVFHGGEKVTFAGQSRLEGNRAATGGGLFSFKGVELLGVEGAETALVLNEAEGEGGGAALVGALAQLVVLGPHALVVDFNAAGSNGGGVAVSLGAALRVLEEACPGDCGVSDIGDGVCNPQCMKAECNWDAGDCDDVLQQAGEAAQNACDREVCALADHYGGCTSQCFTAECDFHREQCAAERARIRGCPVFDATVLQGVEAAQALTYVKGGNAVGYGRCNSTCRAPDTVPGDLAWTAGAVGAHALQVGPDQAWAVSLQPIRRAGDVEDVTVEAWVAVEAGFAGRGYVASWEHLGLFVSKFADQGYYFGLDAVEEQTASVNHYTCRAGPPTVVTALHGMITDGDMHNYSASLACQIILAPQEPSGYCGTALELEVRFEELFTEENWDFVFVYHCSDTSCDDRAEVPGSPFSGERAPFSISASASGVMMVELTSDGSINFPGFTATFDARPATDAAGRPLARPAVFPGVFAGGGSWHHLAVAVARPGEARFYLDGELVRVEGGVRVAKQPVGGGFGVGQRFMGADASVAGRLHGSIDEVRVWEGGREGADAGVGCGDMGGETALLLCLDFEEGGGAAAGNKAGEGGGGVGGVEGDKHLPWCVTRDDGGRRLLPAAEGFPTLDLGLSWGFCSPDKPRLPGAAFDYDPAELRAVAEMSLTDVLAAESACGWYPLQFRGNRAAGGHGGGLYEAACAYADLRGECFFTGMISVGGGMTLASFHDNVAAGAGGAAYVECGSLGRSCEDMLEARLAWPLASGPPPRKVLLQGNSAGTRIGAKGADVGTGPKGIVLGSDHERDAGRFEGWFAPMQREYVPGQSLLNLSMAIEDDVGSLVVGSAAVPNQHQFAVLLCPVEGECDANTALAQSVLHRFPSLEGDPLSRTLDAPQHVTCPVGASRARVLISLVGAPNVPDRAFQITCLPCQSGQSRVESLGPGPSATWTCATCDPSRYVLEPNRLDADGCQPCPRGLRCFGNDATEPRVEGANWTVEGGIVKLHSCPEGSRVAPQDAGAFDAARQECLPCGLGEECTAPPCVTCAPCQPGSYKDSQERRPCTHCPVNTYLATPGAQTASSCTPCPPRSSTRGRDGQTSIDDCVCDSDRYLAVSRGSGLRHCEPCPRGAECNGTTLKTRDDLDATGEVRWERDGEGVFHLKQCPRGYRLRAADVAVQECARCGAGEYILASDDATLECQPCIEGMFCVGGGAPSSHPPLSVTMQLAGLEPARFSSEVALTAMLERVVREAMAVGDDAVVSVSLVEPSSASSEGSGAARREGDAGRAGASLTVELLAVSESIANEDLRRAVEDAAFAAALRGFLAERGHAAAVSVGAAEEEAAGAVGGFAIRGGAAVLISCPPGYLLVNSSLAAQGCKRCEALTYSVSFLDGCDRRDGQPVCRDRECQACPIGARCEGGDGFEPLVPGSVWELEEAAEVLSLRLRQCPPGFLLLRGESASQDQCQLCPDSTYSLVATTFSAADAAVIAQPAAPQACLPCPLNAVCRGSSVRAEEGYWRGSDVVLACKDAAAQSGCTRLASVAEQDTGMEGRELVYAAAVYRCAVGVCRGGENRSRAGAEAEAVCREGHTGPGCGLCEAAYGMKGRKCDFCEGSSLERSMVYYVLFPVLGLLSAAAWYFFALRPLVSDGSGWEAKMGGWCLSCCSLPVVHVFQELIARLHEAPEFATGVKILVGFCQVLGSLLENLAVDWPPKVVIFMEWVSLLQFQFVSVPQTGCLLRNTSFFDRLMAQTLFPVLLIVLLALPSIYVNLVGWISFGGRTSHPRYHAVVTRFLQTVLLVIFIIYPSVSAVTLSAFRCIDYGADGVLLDVDHRVDCDSAEYRSISIWAAVCVLLYPIGIPAFMMAMLLKEGVARKAREKAEEARLEGMLTLLKRQTTSMLKTALFVTFGVHEDEAAFAQRLEDMFAHGKALPSLASRSGLCPRRLRRAIAYITQIAEDHLPHEQVEELFEKYCRPHGGIGEEELRRMVCDVVEEQGLFTGQERARDLSLQQLLFLYNHDWTLPIPRALAHTEEELEYNFTWYKAEGRTASILPPSRAAPPARAPEAEQGSDAEEAAGEGAPTEGAGMPPLVRDEREVMSERKLRSWLHHKSHELVAAQRIAAPGTVWKDDGDEAEQRAIARLGFLFLSYRVDCWYFELVFMFYKLAMSSFVIFLFSGTPSQVAAAHMITLACLVLNLFQRPFVNQELFRMQAYSLITQTLNLLFGMMMISGSFEEAVGNSDDDAVLEAFLVGINLMVFILPLMQLLFDGRAMYIRYKSNQAKLHRMVKTSSAVLERNRS